MRLAAAFFVALAAFGQDMPEIRGTVTESGSSTPIPGVEVTVTEFVPNADNVITRTFVGSTITGPTGAFTLQPGHLGSFMVAAKKSGYNEVDYQSLVLTAATPVYSMRMSMLRPATLIGRVIDRDGNPVRNQRVVFEHVRATSFAPGVLSAVTDAEGIFTGTNLPPGSYLVSLSPQFPRSDLDLPAFTQSAFETVDEDIETSYWPGGVANPDQALPITVAGGIANVGTITLRRTSYYRVRVQLTGSCAPNQRWTLRLLSDAANRTARIGDRYSACSEDALLTGIAPGSYTLAVWTGRNADRWALAPFTITDKNTRVTLTFNDSATISGSLIAADGADLAKLGSAVILVRPSAGVPGGQSDAKPDASGKFTLEVPWKSQWISVQPSNPASYVKEIRYNHLTLRTQELDAALGSPLEVVLDSGAASLTGMLKKGETVVPGNVFLFPASVTTLNRLAAFPPFSMGGGLSLDTRFTLTSIPPGDYRVIGLPFPSSVDYTDANELTRMLASAEKITLGRGEQRSIEIQVK